MHVRFLVKLPPWVQEVARVRSCPWPVILSERQDGSGPEEEGCGDVRGGEKMLTVSLHRVEGQDHVANGEGQGQGQGTMPSDLVVLLKESNNNNDNNEHQQQ